jgi:hypothetical protein
MTGKLAKILSSGGMPETYFIMKNFHIAKKLLKTIRYRTHNYVRINFSIMNKTE